MASLPLLIQRIRRRVHDARVDEAENLPHYSDEVYSDAIQRALMRVNLALSTNYSVPSATPRIEYLMELRGTIEMCHIRGAEGATGDVYDPPDLAPQTISLPGGLTHSHQQLSYEGSRFWRQLTTTLEAEYKDALEAVRSALSPTNNGDIVVGVMQRMSNRSRRASSYAHDRPLVAPDVSASAVGSSVTITWTPLLTEFLGSYIVERSTDSFVTHTQVYRTYDNQVFTYTDVVPAGVYQYRLKVLNSNDLASYSVIAEVLV